MVGYALLHVLLLMKRDMRWLKTASKCPRVFDSPLGGVHEHALLSLWRITLRTLGSESWFVDLSYLLGCSDVLVVANVLLILLFRRSSRDLLSCHEPFSVFFQLLVVSHNTSLNFDLWRFFSLGRTWLLLILLRKVLVSSFTICGGSRDFRQTPHFRWDVSISRILLRACSRDTCVLSIETKVWRHLGNLRFILLPNHATGNLRRIRSSVVRIPCLLSRLDWCDGSSRWPSIMSAGDTISVWTLTWHLSSNS